MPAIAQAADPDASSIAAKEKQVQGGANSGTTEMPVTKPDAMRLDGKVQADLPGTKGGTTADPTPTTPSSAEVTPPASSAVKDKASGASGKN